MKKMLFIISLTLVCGLVSCSSKSLTLCSKNLSTINADPDFFPIAVWLQNPDDAISYKNYGINMFVGIWGGLDQSKLDLLKASDMKVLPELNEFCRHNLNEPLIYGWLQGDEPDNAQWNERTQKYDPCIDPSIIIQNYNRIKDIDPSRPVYLNVGRGVAVNRWFGRGECTGETDMYKISNNGYLKGCDIVSFDVYPVNSNEKEVKDSIWYVAKGLDSLRLWSDYSKPAWCWIETTKIGDENARKPTTAEVKSEVWMALIHGASGIGYFCHSFSNPTNTAAFLHDKEMITSAGIINHQITSLASILNSPTIQNFVTVKSSNPLVPIDFIVKKKGKDYYVFAISMRPDRSTARFAIEKGKKVEVIGENRTLQIDKDGSFSDEFSDYSVHLYKILSK